MHYEAKQITSIFKRPENNLNPQQPRDNKHLQSYQESAIYILQTIKVNKQNTPCFMLLAAVIWCPDMQL